jgi:hypothetical protein
MTFRDDHEAAVQRADALERELAQTKEERERLQAEVEQMRQAALAPPQQATESPPEEAVKAYQKWSPAWLLVPVAIAMLGIFGKVAVFVMLAAFVAAFGRKTFVQRKRRKRERR